MSVQLLGKNQPLSLLKRFSSVVGQNRLYSKSEYETTLAKIDKIIETKYEPDLQPYTNTITVVGPANIAPVSGIPEEHIKERTVRIYQTPKNSMQSGTENAGRWELEFDTKQRWENPLMGWSSTGDPHSNVKCQFNDLESAISYVEKNGWQWFLEPEKKVKPKVKSYGFNFSWSKRSRVSTK